MPGPDELERMTRETPADPAQEKAAAEALARLEELSNGLREMQQQQLPPAKVLVFDGETGELTIAPSGDPVARKDVVLQQIYDTGFFGKAA